MRNTTNTNRNDMYDTSNGFYIQNILAGPLVICDPPHLKTGLHLDPIQPGEVIELSYYDSSVLARSAALNNAIRLGYAERLSPEEYDEQLYLNEQKQIEQMQEIKRKIADAEVAGHGTFEAEQINLATAGNPHGDYSAEALLAQKDTMNDQAAWVSEYRAAKAQGLVRSPGEFTELVNSGRIATRLANRGRKVSLSDMHNFNSQDQIQMTKTSATIGMPGAYNERQDDGSVQERGGVYTEKRALTNFNSTGRLAGAVNQYVEEAPNGTYADQRPMPKRANVSHPGHEESLVEDIDLEDDDNAYEQKKQALESDAVERYTPRSPYLGATQGPRPAVRR